MKKIKQYFNVRSISQIPPTIVFHSEVIKLNEMSSKQNKSPSEIVSLISAGLEAVSLAQGQHIKQQSNTFITAQRGGGGTKKQDKFDTTNVTRPDRLVW